MHKLTVQPSAGIPAEDLGRYIRGMYLQINSTLTEEGGYVEKVTNKVPSAKCEDVFAGQDIS